MGVLIRHCAAPAIDGEKAPDAIKRAAMRAGILVGRATSYWYLKAQDVPFDEAEAVRECAIRHTDDVAFLRDELRRLTAAMSVVGAAAVRLAPELLNGSDE